MEAKPKIGLILTGGGARAAYQVGVLEGIVAILRDSGWAAGDNPFGIICGTSAGAINATALACHADDFASGLAKVSRVWSDIGVEAVYRADSLGVLRSGAKWLSLLSFGWMLRHWKANPPNSLLDNTPLASLLNRVLDFSRLDAALRSGHLHALAITASSHSSGEHLTFFQCAGGIQPWTRSQRQALPTRISIDHLLASSAIPLVFPATALQCWGRKEYFGDGSMRQLAPISPAIHLGADKVLVIGAGRLHEAKRNLAKDSLYPSLAQIAGHAMSSIFLDSLAVYIERMTRINTTLTLLTPEQRVQSGLRPIDLLTIAPSERLDDIASRHVHSLPKPIRLMLGVIGATEAKGGALASYLLFEASYTKELMALGRKDAFAEERQIRQFFNTDRGEPVSRR